MFKFLISLFTKKTEEEELLSDRAEHTPERDFDFIDYDGIGNQGRFPVEKNKRGRK